jgi:hypothetical protein
LIDILGHRGKNVPRGKVEEGCQVVFLSVNGGEVMGNGVLNSALLMWLLENIICSLVVLSVL